MASAKAIGIAAFGIGAAMILGSGLLMDAGHHHTAHLCGMLGIMFIMAVD